MTKLSYDKDDSESPSGQSLLNASRDLRSVVDAYFAQLSGKLHDTLKNFEKALAFCPKFRATLYSVFASLLYLRISDDW